MRKDQIFVLMLVIFLPLTGCFGDAIGEAEAEEETEGTTVVNNYYNNTTVENTYQNITQILEPTTYYMNGYFTYDTNFNQSDWSDTSIHSEWHDAFTINQSAHEVVSITSLNFIALVNYSECESFWLIGDCGHGQMAGDYVMYGNIPASDSNGIAITCANGISTHTIEEPRTDFWDYTGINANFPGMDCSYTYQVRNYAPMEVWWSVSYTVEDISPGPHN